MHITQPKATNKPEPWADRPTKKGVKKTSRMMSVSYKSWVCEMIYYLHQSRWETLNLQHRKNQIPYRETKEETQPTKRSSARVISVQKSKAEEKWVNLVYFLPRSRAGF